MYSLGTEVVPVVPPVTRRTQMTCKWGDNVIDRRTRIPCTVCVVAHVPDIKAPGLRKDQSTPIRFRHASHLDLDTWTRIHTICFIAYIRSLV